MGLAHGFLHVQYDYSSNDGQHETSTKRSMAPKEMCEGYNRQHLAKVYSLKMRSAHIHGLQPNSQLLWSLSPYHILPIMGQRPIVMESAIQELPSQESKLLKLRRKAKIWQYFSIRDALGFERKPLLCFLDKFFLIIVLFLQGLQDQYFVRERRPLKLELQLQQPLFAF